MIALIGIFVITSSACVVNNMYIPKNGIVDEEIRGKLIVFNNDENISETSKGVDINGKKYVIGKFEEIDGSKLGKQIERFIRISPSTATAYGEIARPVCDWIGCKWIEYNPCVKRINSYTIESIYPCENKEAQQCVYCDKKRIKKEVWEDVR